MVTTGTGIDHFFHDWRGGVVRDGADYGGAEWRAFADLVRGFDAVPGARAHDHWADDAPCSMHIEEVEAIWRAIDAYDDWRPLHAKVAAIRRMGDALGAGPGVV
jgi:hypothetical protein